MRRVFVTMLLGLLVAGCDSDDGGCPHTARCGNDAKQFHDASSICGRMPAEANRSRFVVIAHPYDTAGNASATFEVLQLAPDGTLARFSPPKTFTLGNRAPFGTIAFTPDAKLGLVPLDDGKVGVFGLDADGTPTVIDLGFAGGFYANRIVADSNGDYAWVVDSNTRANGGGIYRVTIGCDGMLADPMLYVPASSAGGLAFTEYGVAIVAARDIGETVGGVANDVYSLLWRPEPHLLGAADPFGNDNVIFSGFAISTSRIDGSGLVLIGDSNVTGTNRVAGAGFDAGGMLSGGGVVASDITDPSGIAISPFDDVAVVTSSQPPGEGIYILGPDTSSPNAWTKTEVTYKGAAAQLPGDVVTINVGYLKGSVIVSELSNVRRLQFHTGGSVTDEGSLALGSGLDNVVGAIGVTP